MYCFFELLLRTVSVVKLTASGHRANKGFPDSKYTVYLFLVTSDDKHRPF